MSRPHALRTLKKQPHPPGIYASKYEFGLGLWICQRIAAGESIRSICRADPRMPTEKTVWNWARRHLEFRMMKAAALRVARRRSLAARDAANAPSVSPDGLTPPPSSSRQGRKAWNAGLDGYALMPETAEAVLQALCDGRALEEVCRTEPWAPSVGTFYNWLKRYPELLAEYRLCKAASCEHVEDRARESSPWLGSYAASMRALNAAERDGVRRAAKLAPKRYA